MKFSSTLFLKLAIVLIGAAALVLVVYFLPLGINSDLTGYYRPLLYGMYAPAVPFFIALHQALKLLGLIDQNQVFSKISVSILKKIKYCALVIAAMYTAGLPYIYYVADKDDAPGVAALGFVIIFASFVITVSAGVFQSLLQNAVDLKSENDLTV